MENQIKKILPVPTRILCIAIIYIHSCNGILQAAPADMGARQPVFVENAGQISDLTGTCMREIFYSLSLDGMHIFLHAGGLSYIRYVNNGETGLCQWERTDLILKDAQVNPENIRKVLSSGVVYRYFTGPGSEAITPTTATELNIQNVYPGIDWRLCVTGSASFKYDFIIHPGASPEQVRMLYTGAGTVSIDAEGSMIISSDLGIQKEYKPFSYQNKDEIESAFYIEQINELSAEVGFAMGAYDPGKDLVIDPELYWATYCGGAMEECFNSVCTDADGNLLLTGWTDSPNFPTLNAGTFYQGTKGANEDVMIMKFSPTESLLWSTFYGGNQEDWGYSIAADNSGNIFVVGETVSTNFPTYDAGTYFDGTTNGEEDVFILKFDSDGNRLWATYYGGDNKEGARGCTVDASGNVFVTGYTRSTNFPKQNAGTFYQGTIGGNSDAFLLKFNNAGTRMWATYYGGSSYDIGTSLDHDASDNIFMTGTTASSNFPVYDAGTYYQSAMAGDSDLYVLKFTNSGNRLWATYYGGSDGDYGSSVVVDLNDAVYVGGYTASTDLPVQSSGYFFQGTNAGSYDACLLKFENDGTRTYATYVGGSNKENTRKFDMLATDMCGNIYAAFTTFSSNMPLYDAGCSSFYDAVYSGNEDIFIMRCMASGQMTWATYYGYDNNDLDACIGISQLDGKSLYMTGQYNEYDPGAAVPLVNPGGGAWYDGTHNGDNEAFIAKFIPVDLLVDLENSNLCLCTDTAIALPSCGVEPYTYLWSDGQTTQTAIDLCPGEYTVVVTDADCNIDTNTVLIDCMLPIQLENFTAEYKEEKVFLQWHMLSQENISRFTIERSTDAVHFYPVNEIAGNPYVQDISYTETDEPPCFGTVYYNLKALTDVNRVLFEALAAADIPISGNHLIITGMNKDAIQCNYFSITDQQIQCILCEPTGRILTRFGMQCKAGNNILEIPVSGYPKGVYILSVFTGSDKQSVSCVI